MRYPQDFVDKVLEAANVVEIISQYTDLKHSGGGFMGRCPFPDHKEKTPSFSVSESKQVYHCFGCKKSGNVFSFLRDYSGMSFVEALEYLADRYRIEIPQIENSNEDKDAYQQMQDKKKQILKLNRLTADFYRETLKRVSSDHPIKQYVKKRRLSPETLEEFQIGFAPAEWDNLANYLHKQGVSLSLADEAKLVKARKEANGYFDLFRDRLMFPILAPSGEVLAFGGRIHEQGEPKYLNSPETFVFSKSKVLYGLAHTAKYIRSEDSVVLVEGYMDLVSLFQSGLKNVAATMGTALTPEHAKLVKRMTSNVVVLFDGDDAGRMAAERSLTILLAQGLYPKGLILTEAKDPDEYINKFGLDALQKKIQASSDLFSVVLNHYLEGYRGEASEKVKIVDRLSPIFDSIADPRLKNLYLEESAMRLGVTKQWQKEPLASSSSGQRNHGVRDGFARGGSGTGGDFRGPESGGFSSGFNSKNLSGNQGEVPSAQPKSADEPSKIMISNASRAEITLLQAALKSRANFEILLKICDPAQQEKYQMGEGFLPQVMVSEGVVNELTTEKSSASSAQSYSYKQFLSQISHSGIRQILEKTEDYYRQNHSHFDKLVSLLIERVDKPELLFSKDLVDEADLEKNEKYILDVLKKNQQIFLKRQSKEMVLDVKKNLDEEKIKKLVELHKTRLSLKK